MLTALHIGLEEQLKQFWDLEAIGVKQTSIYDELIQTINFKDERYEVKLPWKKPHPTLTANYQMCFRRLKSCFQRLKSDPPLLKEYESSKIN
ncbi:hypothetical protein SNE40_001593 [Patella caerulea]|uniref:Uncharacterized protein n=1 Tax=Patella caerulea TaxID=87958 RepID=A0AAN8KP44_PATCE